jgi:hypothetical protein
MIMATAVVDVSSLLKGIPSGAWVAISERQNKVVAYGADAQAVSRQAKEKGEANPLMVRVPDPASLLFL